MGLQDKLSAAKAEILRQIELKNGENIEKNEGLFSDELMALVLDLDLALV